MRGRTIVVALGSGCLASLCACATHRRPTVAIERATAISVRAGWSQTGSASWYGPGFAGRRTASGEVFDPDALTAAHRTLPFGTRIRVTLLSTGKSVVVRVNDRLPRDDRIVDLARAAARRIGLVGPGTGRVRLVVVE
jgi:rare lipoprotein A